MEEMSRASHVRLSRRELLAALLLFALLCLLTPRALGAHVARMEPVELAAASAHVVVAVVERGEVRWNEQRTLLFTDYTLRVEDRLRGGDSERITLSMPGGNLGDFSDETCLSVQLEPGARYLLFLDDPDRRSLTPVVGAWQGAFRETPDGLAAMGPDRTALLLDGRPVRFRDLVAATRTLVEETPRMPRPAALADLSLPAKTWVPAAPPVVAASTLRPVWGNYLYGSRAVPPIVVNPLLPGSPFSPADQQLMAYWNLYAGDLFRVSPNPTAQWAFGNKAFDLAGFPDETQMFAQFQVTWGDLGSGVLGVAFVRREGSVITEADVALNPMKPWTLDDETATVRGAPYSFKEVMLHELGHVWGLRHAFDAPNAWMDSVMHYKSKIYYLSTLYADDARAVRAAFPPGAAIRDGLVSSYVTSWQHELAELATYTPAAPKTSKAKAGGTFSLTGPIKVENAGTVPLSSLKVEVYLVPRRFTFDGAVRVKTVRLGGSLQPGAVRQVSLGKVRIPASLPAGTYYLAYSLRDPRDVYPANNRAWSNADVTLTVTGR